MLNRQFFVMNFNSSIKIQQQIQSQFFQHYNKIIHMDLQQQLIIDFKPTLQNKSYLDQRIFTFICMLLAWFILFVIINYAFQFKQLKKKVADDTKNRIVSVIHGITTFGLACYVYLPYPTYNQTNTDLQSAICMFSLAYSVYDLLSCLYYGLVDMGLIIHHLCCAVGFGSAFFTGYGGIDSIGGLFVAQASNFPMHLRCILRNFGKRYTKSYEYSQNAYLFLYILFRGIIGPYFVWWLSMNSENSPIPVKIVCTLLFIQSFYYIYQMIEIINRKIRYSKQMKAKQIQMKWMSEHPDLPKLSFYKKPSEGPKIF